MDVLVGPFVREEDLAGVAFEVGECVEDVADIDAESVVGGVVRSRKLVRT